MKNFKVFDGKWFDVDEEWLNGVSNIDNIDECHMIGEKLKVIYNSGLEVYYNDIHGTWGFPTTID